MSFQTKYTNKDTIDKSKHSKKGDWICTYCMNYNYSFRKECSSLQSGNRCTLNRIKRNKKKNKKKQSYKEKCFNKEGFSNMLFLTPPKKVLGQHVQYLFQTPVNQRNLICCSKQDTLSTKYKHSAESDGIVVSEFRISCMKRCEQRDDELIDPSQWIASILQD